MGSLRRIGTGYRELYFCHRQDNRTPLEETVHAMKSIAQVLGSSHTQLALVWGTALRLVTSVVRGATSVAQLPESLAAGGVLIGGDAAGRRAALFPPIAMFEG